MTSPKIAKILAIAAAALSAAYAPAVRAQDTKVAIAISGWTGFAVK